MDAFDPFLVCAFFYALHFANGFSIADLMLFFGAQHLVRPLRRELTLQAFIAIVMDYYHIVVRHQVVVG